MVKLKKKVGKNKISCFFKSAPLILFFHGLDRKDFYKKFNTFLITERSGSLKRDRLSALQWQNLDVLKKRNDSIPEIERVIAHQGLTVKSIKNSYAKKHLQQLLVRQSLQENSILQPENPGKDSLEKVNVLSNTSTTVEVSVEDFQIISKISSDKENRYDSLDSSLDSSEKQDSLRSLQNKNPSDHQSQKNLSHTNSLFQGKILCLAFKDISFLGSIKSFIENKDYHVLGGIYDNNIIDASTVKRLAAIIESSQSYPLCLDLLKSCNNRFVGTLSSLLDFSYLHAPQRKLIALMEILHRCKIQGLIP